MSDKYGGEYPRAWSSRDISLYEQFGREPAKTSNGLWVADAEREAKLLINWSVAELFALASGELMTSHTTGTTDYYVAVRSKAVLEDTNATRWGEEDLDNWLLFEKTPEITQNGNYINDPERWIKDAAHWNDSELVDLGMGCFGEIEKGQLYILDEACVRFNLPFGITFEEYCEYIQKSVWPVLAGNGVLVNDRNRSSKPLDKWTDDELTAWVGGEIQSDTEGLFEHAIEHFGGEWYWGPEQLKHWVTTGDVPEFTHDYDSYTDAQLQRLVAENGDKEAAEWLERRHPPEPEVELEDSPVVEDADPTVDEGYFPEPIEEPEPEEEIPEEDEPEEVGPVEAVVEDVVEIPIIVETGSPLEIAILSETSSKAIEDSERRKFLPAVEWTAEELVGWVRQLIPMGMNVTDSTLMTAIRSMCTVHVHNWTDTAVKRFILTSELPEGFMKGMLVHDRIRELHHPADWDDKTLKAWAAGEIQTSKDRSLIMLSARIRFNVPDRLSEDEALHFIVTGSAPGVVIPEITNLATVSNEQLIGYLKGTVKASAWAEDDIMMVIRPKFSIDPHWTDAHIYSYYRNGSAPVMTTTGVMVEDRLRNSGTPLAWSWDELKALALGEVDADFSIGDEVAINRVRRLISVQFNISAAHWADAEVIEYLTSNVQPLALEDGVYLNDPTRPDKVAIEWRDAELRAWLAGKIEATEKASEDDLWEEIYVRFKVPVFWYREDAKAYVLKGVRVPSTPSGIYIRDRNRDHRKIEHWTRREVKAWARGQILPGIRCDEAAMANRAARLFNISTQLDTESIRKRISDIHEESITMTVKFVEEDLKSYAKGREEAGDNAVKAAPYQTLLDRCINRVLRLQGEDFVQGWTELLNFFHANSKGVTSAKKVYIGVGQMAITGKGLRNFQNLTSILQSTANPEGRDRAIKLIDWTTALKEVPNEVSRQSILAYYGL